MDIAAAMRAQLLGQFIDSLASGAAKAAALPGDALKAGQTVTATVLGEAGQGGLALQLNGRPIVADISGARLPAEARQPGSQLTLRVDGGGATPRLSLTGFETSGAKGSTAAPPPASLASAGIARLVVPPDLQPAQAAPPPAAAPLQAALKEAMATAAARQGSAAPLYANLAAVTAKPASPLPEPLRAVAGLLLANRLDASEPILPEAVRQAVALSGVLADAQAARDTPLPDVKSLLAALKALLPRPTEAPQAASRDATPPEPPRRDAGPAAQKPALASLAGESRADVVAGTLARETDQALERVKMHQYASLPEQRPTDQPRQQQLAFELPIALAQQQTAMAGFRLERDRRQRKEDGAPVDVWGIRFAIETDEIGAVHAHLRLSGHAISVSLWADDPLTRQAFTDAMPKLEAALRDNALDIGEIAVFGGRPHEARAAAAGHFLDLTS
jgi:hypothetical protein